MPNFHFDLSKIVAMIMTYTLWLVWLAFILLNLEMATLEKEKHISNTQNITAL